MSDVRLVSVDELRTAVSFEDLVEPVSLAFQESSSGMADNGLIVMFPVEARDQGDVYVKTGTIRGHGVYMVKVSPWFALNVQRGTPQGGFIAVFDSQTGHTLAIMNDEHYLSDIRTAAAGSLAARAFVPPTAQTAAVLGAGVQAFWQPQALYRERPFHTLLIWARNADRAGALAIRLRTVLPTVDIRISDDLEATVRNVDVVITATQARDPLVHGEWLRSGQHVTAVGADDSTKCELDSVALNRANVFVDSLSTAAANGDVHRAVSAGEYQLGHIRGEIGDVLAGRIPGRQSVDDITIAKFVGLGVQDLVAAEVSLHKINNTKKT